MSADLAAIRERLSKATPGPWELAYMMGMESWPVVMAADAELIAHAPTELAELMAEVETLREWVHDVGQAIWQARYDIQTGGGMGMSPGDQFPDFAKAVSTTVDRMVAAEAAVARVRAEVLGDDTEEWVRRAGGSCLIAGSAILTALDGPADV